MLLKLFFVVLVSILVHKSIANPIDIADYWKSVDTIAADIKLGFGRIQYETNLIASYMSSRKAGGPPIVLEDECTVTLNELLELEMVINNALSNASNNDPGVTCKFDFKSNQHNCGNIMEIIQCGIQHMASGISNNAHSLAESMKWKNAYYNLEESSKKIIDNLEQTLSQEYQRELDKLKKQIYEMLALISDLTTSLSNAVLPIVYRIHNLEYDEAWKEFDRMKNDENVLRNIIASAYYDRTYNSDLRNISDNIAQFIFKATSHLSRAVTLNEFAKIINETGDNNVTADEFFIFSMIMIIGRARDSLNSETLRQMFQDYSTIYFKALSEYTMITDIRDLRIMYIKCIATLRYELGPKEFHMSGEVFDFVKIAYRFSGMEGTSKIVQILTYADSTVLSEGIIALIEEVKKDHNDEKPEYSAFILKAICYLEFYKDYFYNSDLEKYFSSGEIKIMVKSFRQLIKYNRYTCKDYLDPDDSNCVFCL